MSYIMNIRSMGSKLFHAGRRTGRTDRQTDRHEADSRFSQFCQRAYKIKHRDS